MSYQTAQTIAETINAIDKKKYLLPAIQREFVWNTYQIERLFDSLMREYPISAFLFWNVEKEKVKDFEFYEFLRDYHERDKRHNPKANLNGDEEVVAVLDGQQRLTSLYIALKGTYAYRLPKKRWDNPAAYPVRKLYLNILGNTNPEGEFEYQFAFLTPEEARNSQNEDNDSNLHFWFEVGKILDMKEPEKVNDFLLENDIFHKYSRQAGTFANRCLSRLRNIIFEKPSISFYLEKSNELDKVLNIFIRINSGGTVLSYSDLLLSVSTAQWTEKDAREEIIGFVDEINAIGGGFNFNKDFILKACLVLCNFSDIAFKVDNFNKKNMLEIEQNWEKIKQALYLTVKLVSSLGFNRETLSSNNALIPIAHYLYVKGAPVNFEKSTNTRKDRKKIQKWLNLSLLRRVFGGKPDNVIKIIRDLNKENRGEFPLVEIIEKFKGTNKSLLFSDDEIENLLQQKYGTPYTYSLLSLLYPSLDFNNKFHVDHIFAKNLFTKKTLLEHGISIENIDGYQFRMNDIANLQLLEDIPNMEKQDKPFDIWLPSVYPTEQEQNDFKTKHFIPKNLDLKLSNFIVFYEKRRNLIIEAIKELTKIE